MQDELTSVYVGMSTDEVQRFADRLNEAGIEAFVEQTQSAMYGTMPGPAGHQVMVRRAAADQARELAVQFEHQWHYQEAAPDDPADGRQQQQVGPEAPVPDRPSDDAVTEDVGGGAEHLDRAPERAESPEDPRAARPSTSNRRKQSSRAAGPHKSSPRD